MPETPMAPECPHCHRRDFPNWARCKAHVKFCRAGRPRRSIRARLEREAERQSAHRDFRVGIEGEKPLFREMDHDG